MSVPTQLVLSVHLFTCLTCVIRKKKNITVLVVSFAMYYATQKEDLRV